jgi:hypothetical protein
MDSILIGPGTIRRVSGNREETWHFPVEYQAAETRILTAEAVTSYRKRAKEWSEAWGEIK